MKLTLLLVLGALCASVTSQRILIHDDLGRAALEVHYNRDGRQVYRDESTGAYGYLGIWEPNPYLNFYLLGMKAQSNWDNMYGVIEMVRGVTPAMENMYLRNPVDFQEIWRDEGGFGQNDVAFWRPICQVGYRSLGDIAFACDWCGWPKPLAYLTRVMCVAESLTVPCGFDSRPLWTNDGGWENEQGSVWGVSPTRSGFWMGNKGFFTTPNFGNAYCLKTANLETTRATTPTTTPSTTTRSTTPSTTTRSTTPSTTTRSTTPSTTTRSTTPSTTTQSTTPSTTTRSTTPSTTTRSTTPSTTTRSTTPSTTTQSTTPSTTTRSTTPSTTTRSTTPSTTTGSTTPSTTTRSTTPSTTTRSTTPSTTTRRTTPSTTTQSTTPSTTTRRTTPSTTTQSTTPSTTTRGTTPSTTTPCSTDRGTTQSTTTRSTTQSTTTQSSSAPSSSGTSDTTRSSGAALRATRWSSQRPGGTTRWKNTL